MTTALEDIRDATALAHYYASVDRGDQVSIVSGEYPTELYLATSLYAICRTPNKREQEVLGSILGLMLDLVVEVARQGTFTGREIMPHKFKVLYGGVKYEIQSLQKSDAQVQAGLSTAIVPSSTVRDHTTDGTYCTVKTNAVHGLYIKEPVTLNSWVWSAGGGLINGTWMVMSIPTTTTFTIRPSRCPTAASNPSTVGALAPNLFGLDQPAVITMYCTRLQGEVGVMPR